MSCLGKTCPKVRRQDSRPDAEGTIESSALVRYWLMKDGSENKTQILLELRRPSLNIPFLSSLLEYHPEHRCRRMQIHGGS